MSHRKTQRRQQPRYRNTMTGLRPSAVSGNGGDRELHHLSQHRECKESRRPKSDEYSEAFCVCLLFSGFAFLDVPDENGANDRNETECRE